MTDSDGRSTRSARPESPEVAELRAIRTQRPELAPAVDLHLELLELQRRVRARVPLPWIEVTSELVGRHQSQAKPLLRFEDIPLEMTDLRLMVRQTADVLRRHGTLEDDDYQRVQTLGRDQALPTIVADWFESRHQGEARSPQERGGVSRQQETAVEDVIRLAIRPFLSRCAEVLQPRPELSLWTHPRCALCGGEPELSVITPAAERHLICGRCGLQWKWDPLSCPFCHNSDRTRITSFATPDGQYRVYGCDECHRYLKAYDGRHARRPVMPVVDSVATLPLDGAAMQRGYA